LLEIILLPGWLFLLVGEQFRAEDGLTAGEDYVKINEISNLANTV